MATRIVKPSSQILPDPTLYTGIEIRDYWTNPYTCPEAKKAPIVEDEFEEEQVANKIEIDSLLVENEDTETEIL